MKTFSYCFIFFNNSHYFWNLLSKFFGSYLKEGMRNIFYGILQNSLNAKRRNKICGTKNAEFRALLQNVTEFRAPRTDPHFFKMKKFFNFYFFANFFKLYQEFNCTRNSAFLNRQFLFAIFRKFYSAF